MWLSDQEVADSVMFMIADHQQRLPDQRMKRIGDNRFECQPGPALGPLQTP